MNESIKNKLTGPLLIATGVLSIACSDYGIYHGAIKSGKEDAKSAIIKYLSAEEVHAIKKADIFRISYAFDHNKEHQYKNLLDSVHTYDSIASQFAFAKTQVSDSNLDNLLEEK